jgi:hypothetical protein
MIINDTIDYYDDNQLGLVNGINNDFSQTVDKYSCWCILFIDEVKIEARIIHNGRGKFKIIEDKSNAKYVNKMVDASDVICCIVKPLDLLKYERQATHLA